MSALIFDVETNSLENPEIIQSAWVDPFGEESFRQFWKPTRPIEFGALATHHILMSDLEDCEPSSNCKLPDGTDVIVGFNVDFDWKAIGSPDVTRIDLIGMCRERYPSLDCYSQTAVYYFLFGQTKESRDRLAGAHDAEMDVVNCKRIYFKVCEDMGLDPSDYQSVWLKSEDCRVPLIMPFGKHRGQPISEVPSGYRNWYLGQADVDPYIQKAFRKYPPK